MKLPDMRAARLSYTGSRRGMTKAQMRQVLTIYKLPHDTHITHRKILHHGGAIGGDTQADKLSHADTVKARVYVHPAESYNILWPLAEFVYPPKPPLERNPDIVEAGDLLIATPYETEEILRSGTWATVRYARRIGKPYVIIKPDGSLAQ